MWHTVTNILRFTAALQSTTMGAEEPEEKERLLACEHLWNSSNKLLANAPTIARHLGFRLVTEKTEAKSPTARGNLHALLCTKCGNPSWTAWTRVRKRARAYKGARNRVLTRCTDCHAVAARRGARVSRPSTRAKRLHEEFGDEEFSFASPAPSVPMPQACRSDASTVLATPRNVLAQRTVPRAVHSTVRAGAPLHPTPRFQSALPTTGAIRKKSKSRQTKRRSSGGISSSALFQERPKLATSFLFEDVEE